MAHTRENSTQAPNLARSAMAPLISATVMMANVSWKAENTISGKLSAAAASAVTFPPSTIRPS